MLIKYLKIKTETLIDKLRERCTHSKLNIKKEREEEDEYKKQIYE
jgi:arginine decarboxylase-like protein